MKLLLTLPFRGRTSWRRLNRQEGLPPSFSRCTPLKETSQGLHLFIHSLFSAKDRQPWLTPEMRS